jgi:hypothetical protein
MPHQVDNTKHSVPLFGSWRKAYCGVVVIFVVEVTFFYFVSRYFS